MTMNDECNGRGEIQSLDVSTSSSSPDFHSSMASFSSVRLAVLRGLAGLLVVQLSIFKCERPPTLREISNLRDPVLDDVFRSTAVRQRPNSASPDETPSLESGGQYGDVSPSGPSQAGPGGPYSTNNQRYELPINHAHALGRPQPQQQTNSGFGQLAETGANVLATGAQGFYRGASYVGEAFGIPQGRYEVPFLSTASQLFGR